MTVFDYVRNWFAIFTKYSFVEKEKFEKLKKLFEDLNLDLNDIDQSGPEFKAKVHYLIQYEKSVNNLIENVDVLNDKIKSCAQSHTKCYKLIDKATDAHNLYEKFKKIENGESHSTIINENASDDEKISIVKNTAIKSFEEVIEQQLNRLEYYVSILKLNFCRTI